MALIQHELKNAYIGELPKALCFTANTDGSTVALGKIGSPLTSITLETSTDGTTWNTYTLGATITLTNAGDCVYFRNASETTTSFSDGINDYYNFSMNGRINCSGDVTYLLNKNGTTDLTAASGYCFVYLFYGCGIVLKTPPQLPATTLTHDCYYGMFYQCTGLIALPKLPATTLADYCYYYMFRGCTSIKLSSTQTGEYQTAYRIPITGTGTTATGTTSYMFTSTGGTFTGTPSINTTYYTSNTVV